MLTKKIFKYFGNRFLLHSIGYIIFKHKILAIEFDKTFSISQFTVTKPINLYIKSISEANTYYGKILKT
jgi:hypothetical protein